MVYTCMWQQYYSLENFDLYCSFNTPKKKQCCFDKTEAFKTMFYKVQPNNF